MKLDIRTMQSSRAREFYIAAYPGESDKSSQEARRTYEAIGDLLRQEKACICQERVFAPGQYIPALRELRQDALGSLADGVEPNFLAAQDAPGEMPGIQFHAVATPQKPDVIRAGQARARVFRLNGCRWVTATGLRAPGAGNGPAQARDVFEQIHALMMQAGADLGAVARTWVFMDDILSWYGPFNQVRSGFFREHGLLGPGASGRLPASTGIGVSPADGSRCAIDMMAVSGPAGSLTRHEAAGKQRSANEYGSAFARAAVADTPAGKTIYVSGTAAIDAAGTTCHLNDAARQIQMTLENVNAVLHDLSAGPQDVVQAMAYCATPQVREEFRSRWMARLPWPWLVMVGDVCRSDLLFEVEVTACPGARTDPLFHGR
jgi:enamine deaminase RidA (YjgF/YER057c/UK114 family)